MESIKMNIVSVGSIEFGKDPMPLIGGPCAIESLDHSLKMTESIKKIADKVGFPFVFKSSFDKANRTSLNSYRGVGLEKGIEISGFVKLGLFDLFTLTIAPKFEPWPPRQSHRHLRWAAVDWAVVNVIG